MPGRLQDKVAIITGAAQGIGQGIAEAFAAQGARLMIADLQDESGRATVETLRATGAEAEFIKTDVSVAADAEGMAKATVDRFGRIDIMVENAGVFPSNLIEDTPEAVWRRTVEVNLFGVFQCVRAVLPQMQAQAYGRIVIAASVTGPKVGEIGDAHYSATKAGVIGFVRTAAIEFAPHGIAINAVEPGYVLSDGMKATFPEEFREEAKSFVPMGRFGEPREVAQAYLFLASDEASYITGQSIVVDGGVILPQGKASA